MIILNVPKPYRIAPPTMWSNFVTLDIILLCPVRVLKALLVSRFFLKDSPLFANRFPAYSHIRDALKASLTLLNISQVGHGI